MPGIVDEGHEFQTKNFLVAGCPILAAFFAAGWGI
jgi:hypothetical protein